MTAHSFQGFWPFLGPPREASLGEILRDPGFRDPENLLDDDSREWRPTEEWECGGDPTGLSTGVEWNDVAVFSPSWESRDGLCT